jgi:hypothetical protein
MSETATIEKANEAVIDAKKAAQLASKYFKSLLPEVSGFSLEEVELSEDGNFWLITLGFTAKKSEPTPTNSLTTLFGAPPRTKFKVFKVDARTGRVISMKIRALG